jgi:hypothetical protein
MNIMERGLVYFLIASVGGGLSSSERFKPTTHRWRTGQLKKRAQLLTLTEDAVVGTEGTPLSPSIGERFISSREFRSLQAETSLTGTFQPENIPMDAAVVTSAHAQHNNDFPHRVRIAPFDLLLAPTPKKLIRIDEDLLLVALQGFTLSFMKKQFGNDGLYTNRIGAETLVDYVIFSDIEENTWSEGENGPDDPPRSILKLNGGVASFDGPDIPTEDEVNEWVETAINSLFVAALEETQFHYVELTQYMVESVSHGSTKPTDIVLSVFTDAPKPSQLVVISPTPQGENGTVFFKVLVSLVVVIAFVVVALAVMIRRNNRAVRILCLSSKENEEVVDFSDDSPISISHGPADPHTKPTDSDSEEEEAGALHHQISLVTIQSHDESSSQSATTDVSIPTVSALSFHNPNPFVTRNLLTRESFQKEREMSLSKDMLYSSWAGKAPSFTTNRDRRSDHSVLRSSYFSAKKEWGPSSGDGEVTPDPPRQQSREFQRAAASKKCRIDEQQDGLYTAKLPGSSRARASSRVKPHSQFGFV